MMTPDVRPPRDPREQEAMNKLMGLAIFGEKVAARTYALMAELEPRHADVLRKFATMEGRHGTWFAEASARHGFVPDRAFADHELGYLIAQVDAHHAAGDVVALAVLQGFIVECLAIAAYEPFIDAAEKYEGMQELFRLVHAEELYHVDWITRYLRLRFFDATAELLALAERVNVQGVDCVGGTMMNITRYLEAVGIDGADCAGTMADSYSRLLEQVGIGEREAMQGVVRMFMPLMRKFRKGEKIK